MKKSKSKSSSKKSSKKNKKQKINIKPFHVIYILVIIVFLGALAIDNAKSAEDSGDSGGGCDCGNCETCQACQNDCGCGSDEDSDGDDDAEDVDTGPSIAEQNQAAIDAQNARTAEECTEQIKYDSTIQGEIMSYTYLVKKCDTFRASAYLKNNKGETSILSQETTYNAGKSMGATGERPVTEGWTKVCVEIDGTPSCS